MNAALFTFTAALRAVTAQVAPDWQRAGVSDNGIEIYVDESSVDSDGTRVSFNHRWVATKASGVKWREMEFFQKFDCGTRRTAVVTRLETKLDGKADLHVYGDGPNEWEDEHANNAATVMIGLACGKKK